MSHLDEKPRPLQAALSVVAALLFVLALASSAAAAPYEQVAHFAESGEEVQLGGVGGMAVNYTGAGGVEPGTVYAMSRDFNAGILRVAMYVPKPGGGLEFREAWEVRGSAVPYERCGVPAGLEACKPVVESPAGFFDVDVDESTGNVYVFNLETSFTGVKQIIEYTPDGAEEITRFGERAPGTETVAESPGKIRNSFLAGGLAVDSTGRVYAYDEFRGIEGYHRLAVYEPCSPGDYESYCYAGEVAGGLQAVPGEGNPPEHPVADAAGNVYVGGDTHLEEYAKEVPTPYHTHHSTPICSFEYEQGGIVAVSVNPLSGEVFFISYKNPKLVHRLSACEGGQFHELETLERKPPREAASALAVDPADTFSAGREAGILYVGSPGPGKEEGKSSLGYIFAGAEENPPSVGKESVGRVTSTSAQLRAQVDPTGFETTYAFQYESETRYEAEEPDELQALTVKATGGLLRLAFAGQATGGAAKATLTAGLRVATALTVAEGTANTSTGSTVLSSEATSFGAFEVGQPLAGAGIPASAKVTAVEAGKITISKAAEASASGVAISSAGPAPLAVGEAVNGAGIPAGTTITAAEAGKVTLSQPASASGAGVVLQAGVAFDASAGQLRRSLQELSTIGPRNVTVTGGPGDETGSSPYEVAFTGTLGDESLSELQADSSQLSGPGAEATVETLNEGGGGFEGEGVLEAPAGGATLEGLGARGVGVTLTGLAPDTPYRFRVVAQSHCAPAEPSKVCEAVGGPKAFRTFPVEAGGLPDERAYELVSPPQKHGGQVLPADPQVTSCNSCKPGTFLTHFPMQSAPSGNAVAYEGTPFAESGGAAIENEYVAHRDPATGTWQSANPTPELLGSKGENGYTNLSAELGRAVIGQVTPPLAPGVPDRCSELYAQALSEPLALVPLVAGEPPHRPCSGVGHFETRFVGASADGSRVFFEANDALTEATPFAPEAEDGGATKFNLYEWREGQLALVNVEPGNAETEAGASFGAGPANFLEAISEEGDLAFWANEAGQLFARIDGEETEEIKDPGKGKFLSASADGSRVLLSDGCLYDLEEEACEDLTAERGGFLGIAGQSEDLSRLYFVDTAVLSGEEENHEGEVAREGQPNLYAWSEGGPARFVAVLLPSDNVGILRDWEPSPSNRTAQASPNGRYLAFLSLAPLTGYDNTGPSSGEAEPEAFVYDSVTGHLACASCDPSGAAPLGGSVLRLIFGRNYLPQPRYLADSGRLFFDSADSLSPADSNEGAEDVYEWEPQGVGTCSRAGGCTALITAGREGEDSNLLATDPSGANAFFTTRDRLVGRDTDALIDLYDAREGGGEAVEGEAGASCEREAEACQSPGPGEPAPPSSTFTGPGNVPPPKPCRKGQVRRNGKCAKPHHKHKPKKAKRGGGR